jgi:hypothetical protein
VICSKANLHWISICIELNIIFELEFHQSYSLILRPTMKVLIILVSEDDTKNLNSRPLINNLSKFFLIIISISNEAIEN